jgi:amino acid adenylation domain-containing protein
VTSESTPQIALGERRRELLRRLLAQQQLSAAGAGAIEAHGDDQEILSYAQQQLWLFEQMVPGTALYNVAVAVRLRGPLDHGALERALDYVRRRHSVLRAAFDTIQARPRQRIGPATARPLPLRDVSGKAADDVARVAADLLDREACRPFDLAAGPLVRALLIRTGEREHLLALTMHHIVGDALSWEVLLADVSAHYLRHTQAEPAVAATEEPLQIEYGDYARWHRQRLANGQLDDQLGYWRQRLAEPPPPLDLPADRPRRGRPAFRGSIVRSTVAAEVADRLRALGRQEKATPFMVALAVFDALLWRYTGQSDITVGTPVACRDHPQTRPLIGLFVNTVLVRVRVDSGLTFRDLLRIVAQSATMALAHSGVPFERLVGELQPARSPYSSPYFQVMFSMRSVSPEWQLGDLHASLVPVHTGTAKRDLTLLVLDHGGELSVELEYDSELYEEATAERVARHFVTLLAALTSDPDGRIVDAVLLDPAGAQVLRRLNAVTLTPPPGRVDELIEAQARRSPDATAVVGGDIRLSYRELGIAADQLAGRLAAAGVATGDTVGVCLDRTPGLVVAVLGILKAGAAFVPVAPDDPPVRRAALLRDAAVVAVVADAAAGELCADGFAVVPPGTEQDPAAAREPGACQRAATGGPASTAYVLYTSGSTGRPKGVVVEHRQILAYTFAVLREFGIDRPLRYLMLQPLTVDSSLTMLIPPLVTGGELHLVSAAQALDAAALADYVQGNAIDAIKIAPSHLKALQASARFADLLPRRLLVIGGEAADWAWTKSLQPLAPDCAIHLHYGPTETTVGVLSLPVAGYTDSDFSVGPLGTPLPGTRAWVLDWHGRIQAPGIPGEVCIGGGHVARGYLGRPGLTAASFVPDPFGSPGDRLYRTGDIGRYRRDGVIEFLGRQDNQVKIHGFRVEPGEIESAVARYPGVAQAVALAREDSPGRPRVVVYAVPGASGGLDPAALTGFLRQRLPPHMVPSDIVVLPELPRTPHGKVDRRALPPPAARALDPSAARPRTELEHAIRAIWQRVLGTGQVGAEQNFFDLGGYSLLIIRLHQELQQELGEEFELIKLFEATTVREQAKLLAGEAIPDRLARGRERGRRQARQLRRQVKIGREGPGQHD